jgi:hypothetical protein
MTAQASSSTRSCHLAIKRYRNCSLNFLFHRLVASHAFAREGEDVLVACSRQEKDVAVDCLFWRILSITVTCYNLQKKLFYVRLLLMTKFFVMRECDNILSGYLCAVTTVFSQQDGIYGLKFPKRFLEISSQEISLFSQLFSRS